MLKTSLIALAAVASVGAFASPITYIFKSIATGQVGDTHFTEAPLTVTVSGDTVDVGQHFFPGIWDYQASMGSVTFSVDGGPSGTFSAPALVFDNPSAFGGTVGLSATGPIGLHDVIQLHGADIGSTFFQTYDLKSATSVMGPGPNPSLPDWVGVGTTAGDMTVTWMANSTFQATPEPASMAALGLGALALIRRRRKG